MIDRQFIFPVVIGLSLTGVGAAWLYLLLSKDNSANDDERRTRLASSRQNEVEVKVPRQYVPVIIGRAGATIKDIQEKTETRINFSKDDADTPDRICKIRGTSESVHLAQVMIDNIIANQPVIEVYEMYVPQRVCGRIIGRGGEVIQQIQAVTGAKVAVDSPSNYNPDSERRIIIKGTAENIASALAMIEEKVQEENEIRNKLDVSLSSRTPRGKISPRNTAVETLDNQLDATESLTAKVPEGLMEVYVSAMETPSQFWVQVVGPGIVALDKLVEEMTEYYNNEENAELHTLKNVEIGHMVAAKFHFDDKWYRSEVIDILKDGQCKVYFVDYGDYQTSLLKDLMELRTDFLSLRLQAIECSLANVQPRDGEWSLEACNRFSELSWLAQWKSLTAKVRGYRERVHASGSSRREGSPIPYVELYDKTNNKSINIGKEMVIEAIAEEDGSWSATSSSVSLTRLNGQDSRVSPEVDTSENGLRSSAKTSRPSETASISQPPKKSGGPYVEIDLITPKKQAEIVDLVTPTKPGNSSDSFIFSERTSAIRSHDGSNGNHSINDRDKVDRVLPKNEEVTDRYIYSDENSDEDSDEMEIS